jgi:hypothetical protein
MSLSFLGMDEEVGGNCPHCNRSDGGLIFVSYSSKPVSCESCLWAKKAEGENVAYLEKMIRERDEGYQRRQKVLKELALELGRKRLERMKA